MDDKEIINLFLNRKEEAIRQTEKKYERYLFTIAWNVLSNHEDSCECVNDTYFKAWNTIPPHLPERLSYYLGKITRQLSIDRWRRRNSARRGASEYAQSLDELEDCVPASETPEQHVDAIMLAGTIGSYLRMCAADARDIFICRYYFCDSIKAIAGYYGMSEPKVKSMLFRTRRGLKEYLEKEGYTI